MTPQDGPTCPTARISASRDGGTRLATVTCALVPATGPAAGGHPAARRRWSRSMARSRTWSAPSVTLSHATADPLRRCVPSAAPRVSRESDDRSTADSIAWITSGIPVSGVAPRKTTVQWSFDSGIQRASGWRRRSSASRRATSRPACGGTGRARKSRRLPERFSSTERRPACRRLGRALPPGQAGRTGR